LTTESRQQVSSINPARTRTAVGDLARATWSAIRSY
jgi:hypothetical protein